MAMRAVQHAGAPEVLHTVFLSSTVEDLREERGRIVSELLKRHCVPLGLELFTASNDPPSETIRTYIERSDFYLLVIGGRFGSPYPGVAISWTQWEFRLALVKPGLHLLCFLTSDENRRNAADQESRTRLDDFRKEVENSGKTVEKWKDTADLVAGIGRAIDNARKRPNAPAGWRRDGTPAPVGDPSETTEFDDLASELRTKSVEFRQQYVDPYLGGQFQGQGHRHTYAELLLLFQPELVLREQNAHSLETFLASLIADHEKPNGLMQNGSLGVKAELGELLSILSNHGIVEVGKEHGFRLSTKGKEFARYLREADAAAKSQGGQETT